jgi:hypothetical protein
VRSQNVGSPLVFSVDPKLDSALARGINAWEAEVAERGVLATAKWLMRRGEEVELDAELLYEALEYLLTAEHANDKMLARAELAEMVQPGDLELADLLWFAVRDAALELRDADLLAEALTHIAEIAFEVDEPTTAAEVWIDFLNWRREPESTSDPETVLTAFDEVIRAAEMDGAHADAARFSYLQVQFQALVDAGDARATVGDWMMSDAPFEVWS